MAPFAGNTYKPPALPIEHIPRICGISGRLQVKRAGARSPIPKCDRMVRKLDELFVLEQWVSADKRTLTTERPCGFTYDYYVAG